MFANNHHSLMGSEEDPKDGKKVAVTVFGAVGIYGVSEAKNHPCPIVSQMSFGLFQTRAMCMPQELAQMLIKLHATLGLPAILRMSSFPP
jgi:hypothetical protein